MKTRNSFLFLLPLLAAASCDDRTGRDVPEPEPVFAYWEQSHSAMAGLAGNVESVIGYTLEEGLRFPMYYMTFDGNGNILSYDPSGMTVPESFIYGDGGAMMSSPVPDTKAGFLSVSRYEFSYDVSGRLSSVRKYEMMPEPVAEYVFTYGDGGVYAPLDITGTGISLVPGVVSVKAGYDGDEPDPDASSSFLFEARDGSAYMCTSEVSSRGPVVREAGIEYSGSLPVSETAVYYSGTGDGRVVTAEETVTYTWDWERGILLSCVTERTDAGGAVSRSETEYSGTFPMKPVAARTWSDGVLQTELMYTYDSEGRLIESAYTPGHEGFGSSRKIEYKSSDVSGNWVECLQTGEDGEYTVCRAIGYRE